RSAVTAAIIIEAQGRRSSVWSALLMIADLPGLLRIRRGMNVRAGLGFDELNLLVLESFLETVDRLPIRTQGRLAATNLILGTRKRACQSLRSEFARARREESMSDGLDEVLEDPCPAPDELLLIRE